MKNRALFVKNSREERPTRKLQNQNKLHSNYDRPGECSPEKV